GDVSALRIRVFTLAGMAVQLRRNTQWLQMTNMISYQGLVRTFLSFDMTGRHIFPQSGTWPIH
ncbi:hypothetical protein, partial [Aeromonas media]|uniref:hypothetical protein n=1 Tax=Aeromonas media TaxID=651 RepID=UPI003D2231E0